MDDGVEVFEAYKTMATINAKEGAWI